MGGKNKMKRKTGLSLMMALLMIVSIFTVIIPSVAAISGSYIEVTKEVYDCDKNEFCADTEAEYGDTVQFIITVTYHNESGDCASGIIVTDTLPAGLEYVETKSVEPDYEYEFEISGNDLIWDFTGTGLANGQSIIIIFDTLVIGGKGNYGNNVNSVNVTAKECAGGKELLGSDTATVYIKHSVDVDKKVWDPEVQKWVDHLDSVIKDVDLQFRIAVTYHGDVTMKCMKLIDCLPEFCLEYADNVYIEIDGETITEGDKSYPEITVTEHSGYGGDKTKILFDWENVAFTLYDGESVIIKFDANVTDYCYEECTIENKAFAHLWGCYGCEEENHVFDCDGATVSCRPHDPVFEKKVWNGKDWVEEANVYQYDYVKFKIELTYYGDYNLTDIKVVDYLPEGILEYVGPTTFYAPATIPIEPGVEYSGDKNTVWWNTTATLNDGDTLVIRFSALAIGLTGHCPYCSINTASYTAIESETEESKEGTDTANVTTTIKPEVGLEIRINKFGIGGVNAVIKNGGELPIYNLTWSISVRVGLLGLQKKIDVEGNIEMIEPGDSETISSKTNRRSKIVRRFGRVKVDVKVTFNGEEITESAKGRVFGRLILLLR